MIEESLAFGGATDVKTAVDVGCGIGGSSRHIVSRAFITGHGHVTTTSRCGCDTRGAWGAASAVARGTSFTVRNLVEVVGSRARVMTVLLVG